MSTFRPEVRDADPKKFAPKGGTAYLMVLKAVEHSDGLAHGRLHDGHGAHCAIGNYFEVNPKAAMPKDIIEEVAAVNDSVPHYTKRQRKLHVMKWLRWRLAQLGMPGYERWKTTK